NVSAGSSMTARTAPHALPVPRPAPSGTEPAPTVLSVSDGPVRTFRPGGPAAFLRNRSRRTARAEIHRPSGQAVAAVDPTAPSVPAAGVALQAVAGSPVIWLLRPSGARCRRRGG